MEQPTTGQIIREWRLREQAMTQQNLASTLGRATGTVNRWEADAIEPRVADIRAMEALKPGLVEMLFQSPPQLVAKKRARTKK